MSPSAIRLLLTDAEKETLLAIAFGKVDTNRKNFYKHRDKLEDLGLAWGDRIETLGWLVIAGFE